MCSNTYQWSGDKCVLSCRLGQWHDANTASVPDNIDYYLWFTEWYDLWPPYCRGQNHIHKQIRDLGTCHIACYYTIWTILPGLSHWILNHPAARTNYSELLQKWLFPYTAMPACIACHSAHWRCQKVNDDHLKPPITLRRGFIWISSKPCLNLDWISENHL